MGTPVSIVIGAALIAAAILVVGRWSVFPAPSGLAGVVKVDRWTGSMVLCAMDARDLRGPSVAGMPLECKAQ